jgi:hypothetical protein
VAYATGGKIHLGNATQSRYVPESELAGATAATAASPNTSYVLSIDYKNGGWSGTTLTFYASGVCGSWTAATIGTMDRALSSLTNYSGCASTLFPGTSFTGQPVFLTGVGASVDLTGNSFNDKARSQKWCPSYGCT